MFQYATARRLAAVHGTVLKIDTTRLLKSDPLDTPRDYALGCFNISAEMASLAERTSCEKLHKRDTSPVFRILHKCFPGGTNSGFRYFRQQGTAFDSTILGLPNNVCLEGFWQSEKYFIDIRALLKKEFTPRAPLEGENLYLAEKIQACTAVSLHVRRGDYLTNPHAARHHGTCDMEYYARAVHFIREKIPAVHLFIFSDDPKWTEATLRYDLPTTFVSKTEAKGEGRDLTLMSMCRHHIIANSSFSWWGAWLGENQGKTVIAPVRWYADPARDTADIIPEGWLRF
jgi:hypothetical protein